MNNVIQLLEKELLRINKPDEEDDESIHGAVLNMRQNIELKLAIRILKNAAEIGKDLKEISWS